MVLEAGLVEPVALLLRLGEADVVLLEFELVLASEESEGVELGVVEAVLVLDDEALGVVSSELL